MTLILTELSEFGVAMAADTAETVVLQGPSGAPYTRVTYGAKKLLPIPALRAGVSSWGLGAIPDKRPPSGRIPTDIWLQDFLRLNEQAKTIDALARALASALNPLIAPERGALGFHIAGVVHKANHKMVTLYTVKNGDPSRAEQLHEFRVVREIAPATYKPGMKPYIHSDGDIALFEELSPIAEKKLKALGGVVVGPFQGRADYIGSWIRFISDLYHASGLYRTIGGQVNTLFIDTNGSMIIS